MSSSLIESLFRFTQLPLMVGGNADRDRCDKKQKYDEESINEILNLRI